MTTHPLNAKMQWALDVAAYESLEPELIDGKRWWFPPYVSNAIPLDTSQRLDLLVRSGLATNWMPGMFIHYLPANGTSWDTLSDFLSALNRARAIMALRGLP